MTRTTVPTDLMPRCQIADPQVQEHLPCQHHESGGVQCENPDPHTDDHWISEHTISHALAGNAYACTAFDPAEPARAVQGPVQTYTEQQMVDALLRCARTGTASRATTTSAADTTTNHPRRCWSAGSAPGMQPWRERA